MNNEQFLKLIDESGNDIGESSATNAIKGLTEKAIDSIIEIQGEKNLKTKVKEKTSIFDYSTLSKNKFSKGNTKVINLVNSLKDKGIITSEISESEELLGKVQHLVRSINGDLAKDKTLPELLDITLDPLKFGENIGDGIATFVSSNSPEIGARKFGQLVTDIIKPLSPNGFIQSKAKFKEFADERNVMLDVQKKLQINL